MYIDSTATIDLIKQLETDQRKAAIVCTHPASDPWSPAMLDWMSQALETYYAGTLPRNAEEASEQLRMSPWLQDTMQIISAYRERGDYSKHVLDRAEELAALLADAEPARRPQLNILPDGVPSFATSTKDFYIHITLDQPDQITYFATAQGKEHFAENLEFNGKAIPQEIRELLSASA